MERERDSERQREVVKRTERKRVRQCGQKMETEQAGEGKTTHDNTSQLKQMELLPGHWENSPERTVR